MKKILYSALALPLLFACSSEDFDNQAINNDPFAGIEKVDATFSMDEPTTRFDKGAWKAEEGDLWGFAWMGDGTVIGNPTFDGKAYQNHNLIQTNGIFKPQTSIYVGKYYLYRPYDKTVVSPEAIHFNSLVNQPLAEGYASTTQAWKDLAKTAINIGDKWTDVTVDGQEVEGEYWNKAGIGHHYDIYGALFSNQTLLDLTYKKNNPKFTAAKRIQGATDIDYSYAANTEVGAADIYGVTVTLQGAANSFTYAPTAQPNPEVDDPATPEVEDHDGEFWADKSNVAAKGFTFTNEAITLTPADAEKGLSTQENEHNGLFWFNSLPVSAGTGALASTVVTEFNTSYGVVTVNSTVGECAYEFAKYDNDATGKEWIKLAGADSKTVTPKTWNLAGDHNTFVNQYGNHKGKFKFDVDFSTGNLATLHIKNDAHLQKLLKFFIASGKSGAVTLNLDEDTDHEFKLSKISIALLQTINSVTGNNVKIQPCNITGGHAPERIVITQVGSENKKAVPALNDVFAAATHVYLANTTWTWDDDDDLPVDANVTDITNLGTITVNANNVKLSTAAPLINDEDATMTFTEVTTVKNALTNYGTINVNAGAELRAYGVAITNDATALNVSGTINNSGVIGVTAGTDGKFYNYGTVDMKSNDAITLLTKNATGADAFGAAWSATNKMGTVKLPNGNPTALVSVSNATSEGFIKYEWPATTTTYATPAGNVKYNTIVVSGDITFTAEETEIKYIEFNGTRTQVVNPEATNKLTELKGVIVNKDKSIILEMTNVLDCKVGAYLGSGATVYKGGKFRKWNGTDTFVDFVAVDATAAKNYLGAWSLDQIVEY